MKISVIEELLLYRRRAGLSQPELAKKMGVPVRTLRAWEQGANPPKPITIRGIRAFLEEQQAAVK